MIRSLLKALDLLEAFDAGRSECTLAELAQISGHPKTTLRTILATLESRGYITRVGARYALGTAVVRLSQSVHVNLEIRDRAAPELRRLADSVGESVYLTVPDGNHVLYIYAIESSHRLEARSAIGDHALFHSTAVGKAALAFLPEEEQRRIVAAVGLPRRTARTITDPARLEHELAEIRSRGYATDESENEEQTYCLGAPIFGAGGALVASCSISGNVPAVLHEEQERLAEALTAAADAISKRLGYVPSRARLVVARAPQG